MKRLSYDKYLLALAWPLLTWLVLAMATTVATGAYDAPSAQDAARVYLAPAEPLLEVGETTTLTIRVAEASELYGVELHLLYDPAVVEVLDGDTSQGGIQLVPGQLLDPDAGFLVANRADNSTGELDYAITLLAPAAAVSGDGILVSFDVRALADGSSQLSLSAILASAEGLSLPVTVEDGRLTVGSGPAGGSSPTPTATSRPGVTASPGSATPTKTRTPMATSQSPSSTSTPAPEQGQPAPATGTLATASTQTAVAPATSEATGEASANDVTESAQTEPGESPEPVAGPGTALAETEERASGGEADPRSSPDADPIAPTSSDSPFESGQDDNPILTWGLVLVAFVLVALIIFFGRRLLSRNL